VKRSWTLSASGSATIFTRQRSMPHRFAAGSIVAAVLGDIAGAIFA
jgi:hypothetical protein